MALFVVRVLAQPLSLIIDTPLSPRFESWQSGLLPYPALVAAQLLIIVWFARTAWRFGKGDVVAHYRRGVFFLALGSLYFLFMLVRLLLGLSIMRDSRFFTSYLPTAFHLVLASWLLVYGHFHLRFGVRA
ncbi:MAG TPA: hypothetical protein VJS39_07000 [Gemmatimonadaceae bacterium]|nr:hypothetical protein [Gemmatimonadaceae bacterium]